MSAAGFLVAGQTLPTFDAAVAASNAIHKRTGAVVAIEAAPVLPVYADAEIDGHAVTLQVYRDGDSGDVVSHCYIERGVFSASLEAADATGELVNFRGTACAIAPATLLRVRMWAEARGY